MPFLNSEQVLSRIYLRAVLPLLEEVVGYDDVAKEMVKSWKCSIMLHQAGGPATTLVFRNGKCDALRRSITIPSIALYLTEPAKLNAMFQGQNVIPIPWMGFWHVGILAKFTELTKRLEYYMQPTDEVLSDKANYAFIVKLMLYAAVFGACEVANHDDHVASLSQNTAEGVLQIKILPDGPAAYIKKTGGVFSAAKGEAPGAADAYMDIEGVQLAYELFSGQTDAMAALGLTDIRIRGLIPFVDNVNAFLDRLSVLLP